MCLCVSVFCFLNWLPYGEIKFIYKLTSRLNAKTLKIQALCLTLCTLQMFVCKQIDNWKQIHGDYLSSPPEKLTMIQTQNWIE